MNKAHEEIKTMMKKRKALTKEIILVFNKEHPIGSRVRFRKWYGDIEAKVIQHDDDNEQVKVRVDNREEYWVGFYWILNYRWALKTKRRAGK